MFYAKIKYYTNEWIGIGWQSGWKEKEFRSREEYKDFIADLYDQNIEWKSIEFKPEG